MMEIIIMIALGVIVMLFALAFFLMFGPKRFENKTK